MKQQIDEVEINGVKYVRKDSIKSSTPEVDTEGRPYVVVRSAQSGCHAGYLESENGSDITLINSRRLW